MLFYSLHYASLETVISTAFQNLGVLIAKFGLGTCVFYSRTDDILLISFKVEKLEKFKVKLKK